MKKYILIMSVILYASLLKAQDPIFDVAYQNRLYMNPAFCGNDGDGRFRVSAFHHNQFINNRGPFRYTTASIDYGICATPLSFGLIVWNETQGDGLLATTTLSPILGSTVPLGSAGYLSTGIQFNFYNYSVDWNKYVFSDQLDPIQGIVQPTSNSNPYIVNQFQYGATIGVTYTGWSLRKHRMVYNVGISYNHLIRPKLSLLNSTVEIPRRLTIHGGLLIKRNPNYIDYSSEFTTRFDYQDNFSTLIFNYAIYINSTLAVGAGFRYSAFTLDFYKNSIKPITEIRLIPNDYLKVILSYGFNLASNSTGLGNSIELGLVFLPKEKFCNPLDVFTKGGSSKSTRPSGRKSKFGRSRLECPVYTKDKNIPTF